MEFLELIRKYVYLEYSFAIWAITETARYSVPQIDKKLKPKTLVLIVSILLSIPGYLMYTTDFDFFKALISFSLSVIGYDYVWKPLKEKFFPTVDEIQKQ